MDAGEPRAYGPHTGARPRESTSMERPITTRAEGCGRRRRLMTAASLAGLLASASAQEASFRPLRELHVDGGLCSALCYAPDGRSLAAGGRLGDVLVLDSSTGEVLHRHPNRTTAVRELVYSPDGRKLAIRTGSLEVWSPADGSATAFLPRDLEALAWSADSTRIAGVSRKSSYVGFFAFGNSQHGKPVLKEVARIHVPRLLPIHATAFSPDGTHLAIAGSPMGRVQVVEPASRKTHPIDQRLDWRKGVAWSGPHTLEPSDPSAAATLFRAQLAPETPHAEPLDGDPAAAGPACWRPDLQQWAQVRGAVLEVLEGTDRIAAFELRLRGRLHSPAVLVGSDDRFVFVRNSFGELRILDGETGERTARADVLPHRARPIANPWGPDLALVEFPEDGPPTFQRWLVQRDGTLRRALELPLAGVRPSPGALACDDSADQLVISRDGRMLGIGNQLVDLELPEAEPLYLGHGCRYVVVSDDGSTIAALYGRTSRGNPLVPLHLHDGAGALLDQVDLLATDRDAAFLDGDRRLLVATDLRLVDVDPRTGKCSTLHERPWTALHVLRDGTVLGVGHDALELWDPRTESVLATGVPERSAFGLSVSADETRILVTCRDRLLLMELAR